MTYEKINHMDLINSVDKEKVRKIADSMSENGYVGCPILVWNDQLLTGSHRIEALRLLSDEDCEVMDWEVAEDVTDIVEENITKFEDENGWQRDIDLSDIGWMLKGSWVEQYKDEIEEW